jgi:hypothetical protein
VTQFDVADCLLHRQRSRLHVPRKGRGVASRAGCLMDRIAWRRGGDPFGDRGRQSLPIVTAWADRVTLEELAREVPSRLGYRIASGEAARLAEREWLRRVRRGARLEPVPVSPPAPAVDDRGVRAEGPRDEGSGRSCWRGRPDSASSLSKGGDPPQARR